MHAIIGPNGAGKTTLINQISGILPSDAGNIVFNGRDITRLPVHARAALHIARSFQITSVLPGFSALENVALAVQARSPGNSPSAMPPSNAPLTNLRYAALNEVGCAPGECYRLPAFPRRETRARTGHGAGDGA